MGSVQMNVRIDRALKASGDGVFSEVGITPTEAVRRLWSFASRNRTNRQAVASLMESLRDDSHMVIYFIRLNQITALVMAVISFVIWMVRWARKGAKPISLTFVSALVTSGISLGIFQEFAVDSNPNLLLEYAIMALALALIAAVSLTIRKKTE